MVMSFQSLVTFTFVSAVMRRTSTLACVGISRDIAPISATLNLHNGGKKGQQTGYSQFIFNIFSCCVVVIRRSWQVNECTYNIVVYFFSVDTKHRMFPRYWHVSFIIHHEMSRNLVPCRTACWTMIHLCNYRLDQYGQTHLEDLYTDKPSANAYP